MSAVPRPETDALPARPVDYVPPLLVVALIALALPAIGSLSTWVTLTVAGIAMGLILFTAASGLTLIFGLMDVLNFGHGIFISLGAFVAAAVLGALARAAGADSLWLNLAALGPALVAAVVAAGLVGIVYERLLIRPVYGQHLKQILITMGGMVIGQELIKAVWGPDSVGLDLPPSLRGALIVGDAAIERYRVVAILVGLAVFGAMLWTLTRTKIGLLVRAGVEDREMVESLGYRVGRLFVGVFAVGSALAGLGGFLWGLYQQNIIAEMGAQLNVLIFIVIIIGGLGSTTGSFLGAILVGLVANYSGFLSQRLPLWSNIVLMVVILMWRPRGLYPVSKR